MRQILEIRPVGNIDRRSIVTQGNMNDVLWREGFVVLGTDVKSRFNKKLPGANRFNSTSIGAYDFQSGIRYYTKKNVRGTYAYGTDGYIYYFDENGNTTQILGVFSQTAVPSWVIIRVSDNDILFFSEGVSTGLFSYDGNLSNTFVKETAVSLNMVDMVSWLDRLWGIEEDEEALNFSKNLDPVNFTDSTDAGVIIVGAKRGSKIQRIIVLNDYLYIFKTDSIWRIIGKTPNEFQVEIVHDSLGLAARWSLFQVENGFMFLGSDYEMYTFGGTKESTSLATYNVALSGDQSLDLGPIINVNKLDNIRATYQDKLYRMAFTESGRSTNNMEYIYNTVNKTESFSRDFNVSCYIRFDRTPDNKELFCGRVASGRLMKMFQGLNVDNGDSTSTMPTRLQTKFIGFGGPENYRVRKVWGTFGVRRKEPVPIRMYKDARNAVSDSTSDELSSYGESKTPMQVTLASQSVVTSRFIPRWNNAKCQNFSLEINENASNRDISLSHFNAEVIVPKNLKRSKVVSV